VHVVFDEFKSRFRKNDSTPMVLPKVSNDLRESFNCGMVSLVLLLDFIRAFDKINHGTLLKTFGLSDGAISWFASYFHGRAQCVSVGGKCSSWLDVNFSVSSGLYLGTTFILPLHQ
jgi:hypothetical protein